ncbi:GtrA-like protein [Candidatus Hepatincolaceae symbiont of Richtersius coronifer]
MVTYKAKKLLFQFTKFYTTGLIGNIVNYSIFYLLLKVFGVNYLVASTCGFVLAVLAGYPLDMIWTFERARRMDLISLVQYFSVYIGSLILGLILLTIAVEILNMNIPIANLIIIILLPITDFLAVSYVVKRGKKSVKSVVPLKQ